MNPNEENVDLSSNTTEIYNQTIKETIDLIYSNIKEVTNNIDIISRKTLIQISNKHADLVISSGLSVLQVILAKSDEQSFKYDSDIIDNIVNLFKELIEKKEVTIPPQSLNQTIQLVIDFIKPIALCSKGINIIMLKKAKRISNLIISIASVDFPSVFNQLMQLYQPGVVPHEILFDLFNKLAISYPTKAANCYQDVISRTLPLLSNITTESLRLLVCKLLSQVCESIINVIENKEDDNNNNNDQTGFNYEALSQLLLTSYDLIFVQWVKDAKSHTVQVNIASSLILIASLLPPQPKNVKLEEVASLFIQNLKKDQHIDNALICKAFRIFIEFNISTLKDRLNPILDTLLLSISPLLSDPNISPNVINYNEDFILFKSEMLKIYYALFINFQQKTFQFLINKFESIALIDKMANAYILKTMLIRIEQMSPNHKDLLCSSLSKATYETDYELKSALFDLIYCIFEKQFMTEQCALKMISFLIEENGYTDTEIETAASNQLKKKSYPFYTSLQTICDKAEMVSIDLITKTKNSIQYYWPNIIEYLTDKKYDRCLLIVCKLINCIKEQYAKQGKIELFIIDYEKHPSLPSPSRILLKIFIALADPGIRGALISECFKFIRNVIPILYKELSKCDIETSEAEAYLKQCSNNNYIDYERYHELLIRLWDRIMQDIQCNEDINLLIMTISEYFNVYKNTPFIIGILMRMQGVLLSKTSKREFIKNQLDLIFGLVHPEYKNEAVDCNIPSTNSPKELRIGLGEAFGLSSRNNNIDIVLDKINGIFKSQIEVKKSSGFSALFSYGKAPELPIEIIISLILSIGSIAKYSPPTLLPNRINTHFLSHIDHHFKNNKDSLMLKYTCLLSYGYIFKSLEQLNSVNIEDKASIYYLSKRNEYLDSMTKIFKAEKDLSEIKIASINNVSHLINLDPPITQEQCRSYISLALTLAELPFPNDIIKSKTLLAMNNVLESIFSHDSHSSISNEKVSISIDSFTMIDFEYMLNYDKETLRQWDYFSFILEKMVERYLRPNPLTQPMVDKNNNTKTCIIEGIQNVVNSKKSVKCDQTQDEFKNWVASVIALMIIAFDESNYDTQGVLVSITRLFTGLSVFDIRYDSSEVFIDDLSKSLKEKLTKGNYMYVIQMLFHLLKIKIESVNRMGCKLIISLIVLAPDYFSEPSVLNSSSTTEQLEQELKENKMILMPILDKLIKTLDFIIKEDSATSPSSFNVLKIFQEFAKLNLSLVIDCCLSENYGLSLSISLECIIESICNDKVLITKVFTRITDIINNSDPGINNEKPRFIVCRSTVILGTMLSTHTPSITPLIKKFIPQLLSTLLLRIGSAHSINYSSDQFKSKEEDPRNQSIWALQQLMIYFDEIELSSCLESNGPIAQKFLSSSEYDEGVYELMMIFCKFNDYEKKSAMYDFLSGFIDRTWNGQRVVVATCYAQFVNYASIINIHRNNNNSEVNVSEWRSHLIEDLTKMLSDSDELARKMAIRGLGNLCRVYLTCTAEIDTYIIMTTNKGIDEITDELRIQTKEQIKAEILQSSLNASIVKLLIEKMSDLVESVTLESLNSLQQMIEFLSIDVVIPCIGDLLVKLRPCFDNDNSNVRALGFNVFTRIISLSGTVKVKVAVSNNEDDTEERFEELIKEQIHLHLVSLLLHANDDNPSVQHTCVKTLIKALFVLLNVDYTAAFDEIKKKYNDYERIYEEFIEVLSRSIVQEYPFRINFYIINAIGHSLSKQDNIRGSSAYLIGVLYKTLKESNNPNGKYLTVIDVNSIFANFNKLLKDNRSNVKIQTMKAIGLIK